MPAKKRPETGIEITPEMIEAGVDAWREHDLALVNLGSAEAREMVVHVFRSMLSAKKDLPSAR